VTLRVSVGIVHRPRKTRTPPPERSDMRIVSEAADARPSRNYREWMRGRLDVPFGVDPNFNLTV